MFCVNCGNQIAEGSSFCPYCGVQLNGQEWAPSQGQPGSEYQNAQGYNYGPASQQQPGNMYQNAPAYSYDPTNREMQNMYPMKWHKFLVYFALWAAAILHLFNGIMAITGKQYEAQGVRASLIYSFFPSLKTGDVIYGVLLIGLAAVTVITALKLLKFKKGAPMWLKMLYLLGLIASLFYVIIVTSALKKYNADTSEFVGNAVISAIISVAMIAINHVYYGKREAMFIN